MITKPDILTQSLYLLSISIIISSCSTAGPSGIFGKRTPHEQYEEKIKTAGLTETALGRQWLEAANKSLITPLNVNLPYSETGYFPADEPKAVGIIFKGRRGEKLLINLSKRPTTGFALYLDFWQAATGSAEAKPKLITAADTTQTAITYNVDKDEYYILRLQPELLKGGEYSLSISTGPSLGFPVSPKAKSNIGSFWGDTRDNGGRKHEGIDIFAPKRSELVAVADGVVSRVEENLLGGKVIFLNPDNRPISVYYAHLDEQIARPGQQVKAGDVIGLVGNTGNARTSSPHLHFGIYTYGGAIDPLPFVSRENRTPQKITAPLSNIDKWVRNGKSTMLLNQPSDKATGATALDANTLLKVEAATANWYRVRLPSGEAGFVASPSVAAVSSPVKKINLKASQPILDEPHDDAARKTTVNAGQTISVLAGYKDYYYVSNNKEQGWISKRALQGLAAAR